MAGFKSKNGALQGDKLKMGTGKNERMTEAYRERRAGTGALHGERYEEEEDREREGWRMEERSRENVSGHCCIAASLLMQRLPLHTPSPSLRSSLAPPSLSRH